MHSFSPLPAALFFGPLCFHHFRQAGNPIKIALPAPPHDEFGVATEDQRVEFS